MRERKRNSPSQERAAEEAARSFFSSSFSTAAHQWFLFSAPSFRGRPISPISEQQKCTPSCRCASSISLGTLGLESSETEDAMPSLPRPPFFEKHRDGRRSPFQSPSQLLFFFFLTFISRPSGWPIPPAAPRTATLRAGVEPEAAAAAAEAEKPLAASLANCGSRDMVLFSSSSFFWKGGEIEAKTRERRRVKRERRLLLGRCLASTFHFLLRFPSSLRSTPLLLSAPPLSREAAGTRERGSSNKQELIHKLNRERNSALVSFPIRFFLSRPPTSNFKCRLAEEALRPLLPLPLDPRQRTLHPLHIISTLDLMHQPATSTREEVEGASSPSTEPASSTGARRRSSPRRRRPTGARSPPRARTAGSSSGRPRGGAACW